MIARNFTPAHLYPWRAPHKLISAIYVTLMVSLCCVERIKTKGNKGDREDKEKEEYNGVSGL